MTHYVVDYAAKDAPDQPIVSDPMRLDDAKAMARKISRQHGSAYVIRCVVAADTARVTQAGQAVYYDGGFSHTDGDF
jgi:hypothetical protein